MNFGSFLAFSVSSGLAFLDDASLHKQPPHISQSCAEEWSVANMDMSVRTSFLLISSMLLGLKGTE